MAPDQFGDVLVPPGISSVAEVKPGDIWASKTGSEYVKGRTIKKVGAGAVIAAGTVMARETATKKYVVYADGGSGGAEVAKGVLLESVDTSTGEKLGNIVFGKAILKLSKLTGLDAAAITDLNGRSDTESDFFQF
jgi:hypothetical protein